MMGADGKRENVENQGAVPVTTSADHEGCRSSHWDDAVVLQ